MKHLFLLLGVLSITVCVSCSEKAQDAAAKSVENMEANGDDSIANTVAVADVAKENMEDNAKAIDVAAKDGKKAIDLPAKHTEEVAKSPTQHTGDVVRDAEQKTKDVDVAIKHTEKVVEKPTPHTGDVVRDTQQSTKDAAVASGNAQQPIEGIWNSGTENTKVEISQKNGEWVGKIISSDNEKATTGTVILKNLKKQHEIWKGELYSPRKKEWFDAVLKVEGSQLLVTVKSGLANKTVKWTKE